VRIAQPVPTSIRLDPDVKVALAKAADGGSISNMLDRILRLWLTEHGHLAAPPTPTPQGLRIAASSPIVSLSARRGREDRHAAES
jgi:hypothetical protein